MILPKPTAWPHAPTHRLSEGGTYFITAGTYLKNHFFRDPARLDVLQRGLLALAQEFGWQLEAWCVFSNHYHFVGHSPPAGSESLKPMLQKLHSILARWVNKLDNTPRRKIWYNFFDTQLTYEKSYLARLHYTHANAVKHGLVKTANEYAWCSAGWFERVASPAQVKTVYGFKIDNLNVDDPY